MSPRTRWSSRLSRKSLAWSSNAIAREDTIAIYAEAYDRTRGAQLPLITADLRTATGDVIGKLLQQKQSSALHAEMGGIGLSATLPLAGVRTGIYVIHVEARAENGSVAQRNVPIRVW